MIEIKSILESVFEFNAYKSKFPTFASYSFKYVCHTFEYRCETYSIAL